MTFCLEQYHLVVRFTQQDLLINVIQNGIYKEYFEIVRGCCPFLFFLCVDILEHKDTTKQKSFHIALNHYFLKYTLS